LLKLDWRIYAQDGGNVRRWDHCHGTWTCEPARQFTDEFKASAVRLVLDEGKRVAAAARDLDLTETALRRVVYGRPRLWKDLKEDGEAVSEKHVKRLMREEQIQGKVPKRVKQTTNSHHDDKAKKLSITPLS
jgi:transposase-like protein